MAKGDKGFSAEEALRDYFLQSGFFAVRGIKLLHNGSDVTDVDIWLYTRPSPVTRQRIIVDAKNRKSPQAMERIIWSLGIKEAIGVEQCIVATTDRRKDVVEFAHKRGVLVLDGNFLARIIDSYKSYTSRLTEEEFLEVVDSYALGKLGGDWKGRLFAAKSRILSSLGFSAINFWIDQGHFFAEQAITVPRFKEIACRLTYLMISYALIGLDFAMKDLSFQTEASARESALMNGFVYGDRNIENVITHAAELVEGYLNNGAQLKVELLANIRRKFSQIPAGILSEFFAGNRTSHSLFSWARLLEESAYARKFKHPGQQPSEVQGLFGVMLDYWGIERNRFFQPAGESDLLSEPKIKPED